MNTFGRNFRVTTFGESHGKALGAVIDGCPPLLDLSEEDIQAELNRRRPGQSAVTTGRQEKDQAQILSGVFEGKTTGAPIAVVIFNEDQRSRDYGNIKDLFRPGHADEIWQSKFGIRDYRGGGRSSGRETIGRVIAGAIAKKILPETQVIGHTVQVADVEATSFDPSVIETNDVRSADAGAAEKMKEVIMKAKAEGNSVGGVAEVRIKNCPRNIGEPVFDKLQARLAQAIMSIGAVRSFEVIPAKDVAELKGDECNKLSAGISGGIATGEDIVIRFVVKATSSISIEQDMKTKDGSIKKTSVHGRHDPCLLPRIVPVAESMVWLVLADLWLEL